MERLLLHISTLTPVETTLWSIIMDEVAAYGVFASYFALIFTSLGFTLRSVCDGVPLARLLDGRPFLFLRIAIAALLCTWFCEPKREVILPS